MRLIITKLLIFIILFAGCKAAKQVIHYQNLPYGPHTRQVLDISTPATLHEKTPVVILVHGGGWMSGDKTDFNFMRDFLLSQNIAVANVNYRLAQTGINYEEMVADIEKSVQYIQYNADRWKIKKQDYIIWGNSAGGHLALLYAYNKPDNGVNAVIAFGAPNNLADSISLRKAKAEDLNTLLPLVTGHPYNPAELHKNYTKASPYHGKQFIPTLLIHGLNDNIVPPLQSQLLWQKLKQENIAVTYIPLSNGGHGGEGSSEEELKQMHDTVIQWIKKYSP